MRSSYRLRGLVMRENRRKDVIEFYGRIHFSADRAAGGS